MSFLAMPTPIAARRLFLGRSGLVLSGALGAELEAIAAYQVGAESKLLQKPVLDLALTFQGHHKEHADVLAKTIGKLGGKAVTAKAKYGHALKADRVGPHHCGLIGRRAGSVPGFAYSEAMKKSKLTWNEKTLDRFLKSPMKLVPGTAMTYDGVPDAKDRRDLIAYLRQAANGPECRK